MVILLLTTGNMKAFKGHGKTKQRNRNSQERTIRRSRRLLAKNRRERLSVGQILGLTPGLVRHRSHTVEEAAAEQMAEIAAARHDKERSMQKGKRASRTSETRKTRVASTSRGTRTRTVSENAADVGASRSKKKVGSARLSFWSKDHAVTPRKSLVAMFDSVSEGEPSVDEEPNTQDREFIKDTGEEESDPNYELTDSQEEELSELDEHQSKGRRGNLNLTPQRIKAMGVNTEYTPKYYESKDNEDKAPPLHRQVTPELGTDQTKRGRRRNPSRKEPAREPADADRGNPEEVVEEGDEDKPPHLTGSSDEEGSLEDHSESPAEYTSGDREEDEAGAPAGAGGPPDDDPSSNDEGDSTEKSESTGSSEEYREEARKLQRRYEAHKKRKKRRKEKKRARRKRGEGRQKEKRKKKHPKHRYAERREIKKGVHAAAVTPFNEKAPEDEGYFEPGFLSPGFDYRHMMSRAYDPFDLKGVDPPWLKDGDQASKDVFRVKYLDYLTKHNTKMRKRAPRDRVLPQSVVECMRPALLEYVCKHLLREQAPH